MARVAMVTGATRGLGAAISRDLLASGWRVRGCYRHRDDLADALRESARREGASDRLTLTRCDLADPGARERWALAAVDAEGGVDALIHAAGPFSRTPLLDESPAAFTAHYEVHTSALHALTRVVAPSMCARRHGRILAFGLASSHRVSAPPVIAAFYCAKLATVALTRAIARELAPHGVTANVISPGVLDSGGLDAPELERLRAQIPAGYVGEARDAVAVTRWLLSDEARYVTGNELLVSGGWGL